MGAQLRVAAFLVLALGCDGADAQVAERPNNNLCAQEVRRQLTQVYGSDVAKKADIEVTREGRQNRPDYVVYGWYSVVYSSTGGPEADTTESRGWKLTWEIKAGVWRVKDYEHYRLD